MPDPTFTYALDTDRGKVRLLLNDVDEATKVFDDAEIDAFLALEGNSVKLAAAQAIDTNADNEVLASKVLRTQDVQTDGAKVGDSMRKHAAALRAQVEADDTYFEIVSPVTRRCVPELTELPHFFL